MDKQVNLISITKPMIEGVDSAEELLAYCARVSNPSNQLNNSTSDKLLNYCMKNKHWSVTEMADMTVEIVTSRAIAQQILRHRSFSFQEFSQRYAKAEAGIELYEARRQDVKNRQNSIDDFDNDTRDWFILAQTEIYNKAKELYEEAIQMGIAKESARFLLPLNTKTRLYMKGSIRSWIHYCNVRCDPATQIEHREIAYNIQKILVEQFPSIKGGLDYV